MITFMKVIFVLITLYGVSGLINKLNPQKKFNLPYSIATLIVGIVGFVLFSLIVKVGAQEVGVIVTPTGVRSEELKSGTWNFVMPWNKVHMMDKTIWTYTCTNDSGKGSKSKQDAIWAPTKDGIKMGFDISVNWYIEESSADWIYQQVTESEQGENSRYSWLEDNVIRAKIKSAVSLVVNNYTPIEAYSNKREEIEKNILDRMTIECYEFKLIVKNVDLREVYYNPEYEKAINEKKLAEQRVLTLIEITKQKQEQLKQAEINKNIAIEKANGEAEALKIKGQSIASNPKIIQLEWIDKWDGKLPTYMFGGDQSIIMSIPNN